MRALYCTAPSTALKGELGGVRRVMQLYEDGLKTRGHEVEYLSIWQEPDWQKYDLCHLFSANGNTFALGKLVSDHLPLVVSPILDRLHPNILLRLNVLLDRYVPVIYTHLGRCAALCRMADMTCFMSTYEKERLASGLGVNTRGIVAHCAVSSESIEPDPGRFGEYASRPYILFLGDAGNPRKNVLRLIKSVRGLDIELLLAAIISDGKTADMVRQLITETPNVHHIGIVKGAEKAFLLQHARVLALPSLLEGIGMAAVEAALVGTTAVITKNGGPPDYFGDLAYYVNPYSVADIRRKIQQAMDRPLDASEWIRQHVSLEHTGKQLEDCYTACLRQWKERIASSARPVAARE